MKIRITERQLKKITSLTEDIEYGNEEIVDTIISTLYDYIPLSQDVNNYDGTTLLQNILVDSGYCVYKGNCSKIDGDFGGTTKKSLEKFIGKPSLESSEDLSLLEDNMMSPDKIGPLKREKNYSETLDFWGEIVSQHRWFIENLERHLGKEYVWGSNGPSTFDCSGLVVGVYGVKDTNANGLYHNYGDDNIDEYNVRPGDLVFFKTTELDAGHAGIVTNTTNPNAIEFIHASGSECCTNWWKCGDEGDTDEVKKQKQIEKQNKSCVVKISDLNPGGYYGKKFVGFGRIDTEIANI
jgi:hypothetical protein